MRRLLRYIYFLSPWVALGLTGALIALYLQPTLLSARRSDPVAPAPAPADSARPAVAVPAEVVTRGGAPRSYADAVARAAPAVVNIATRRVVMERQLPQQLVPLFGDIWPEYRQRVDRSLGSGVIIDASGLIATNDHVIAGAQEIVVQLADGRLAPAIVVGKDPDTDLAVLKISLPKLPVIPLGRSDQLRVGDVVLAIGDSLGFGQTVTQGIVSATDRSAGLAVLENFIQTDAAINHGNSGGALVTTEGELIGINTAVLRDEAGIQGIEGVGFAIPVNLVKGVVDEIRRHGRVERGWSGLAVATVDAATAGVHGVQIQGFFRGSPAVATGLRPGDVLLKVDGEAISDARSFLATVARKHPGSSIKVEGVRPGAGRFAIDLPIGQRTG
jgi:S1-C subfamily serine protease